MAVQDRQTYQASTDANIDANGSKSITGTILNTNLNNLSDSVVFKDEFTSKTAVRVASTANGTLASDFENGDTVDGITLATGDRILLKDQSTASENGIYTVNASGAPTRAADFDTSDEVILGSLFYVTEGTTNGEKYLYLSAPTGTITVGSSNLTFTELGAAFNISSLTAFSGAIDGTNDELAIYDNSASINKRVSMDRIVHVYKSFSGLDLEFGGANTGWFPSVTGSYSETILDDGKYLIHGNITVQLLQTGSATGNMVITGLPRTASLSTLCLIAWEEINATGTLTTSHYFGQISGTSINIYKQSEVGTAADDTDVTISGGGSPQLNIHATISYIGT